MASDAEFFASQTLYLSINIKPEAWEKMAQLTATRIDPALHDETRFALMAVLVAGKENFTELERSFKITSGNLSSHLSKLERAQYISIRKRFMGKRPQTTIEATAKGREAFKNYLKAMSARIEQAQRAIAEA